MAHNTWLSSAYPGQTYPSDDWDACLLLAHELSIHVLKTKRAWHLKNTNALCAGLVQWGENMCKYVQIPAPEITLNNNDTYTEITWQYDKIRLTIIINTTTWTINIVHYIAGGSSGSFLLHGQFDQMFQQTMQVENLIGTLNIIKAMVAHRLHRKQ